jgi:hypothetical protein
MRDDLDRLMDALVEEEQITQQRLTHWGRNALTREGRGGLPLWHQGQEHRALGCPPWQ